jgi:hypothetical protein
MNLKVGRELDIIVAKDILGFEVQKNKKFGFVESTPQGVRPLKKYSKEMDAAWEVVTHLGISLLPIEDGTWFAMVGPRKGWSSPAEFLKYLQDAKFASGGAAVAETAPLAICLAAYQSTQRPTTPEAIAEAAQLPETSPLQ